MIRYAKFEPPTPADVDLELSEDSADASLTRLSC